MTVAVTVSVGAKCFLLGSFRDQRQPQLWKPAVHADDGCSGVVRIQTLRVLSAQGHFDAGTVDPFTLWQRETLAIYQIYRTGLAGVFDCAQKLSQVIHVDPPYQPSCGAGRMGRESLRDGHIGARRGVEHGWLYVEGRFLR